MNEIEEWLQGDKDYASGLVLISRYHKNRILLQNLSRKLLPGKLEYELNKIYQSGMVSAENKKLDKVDVVKDDIFKEGIPKVNPDDLPVHLKQLWDETAEKYRLARVLHEQMKLSSDVGKRSDLIESLENYRQEIWKNWSVIDGYVLTRSSDIKPYVIDSKRISADRKYLSEGKKLVMSLSGAARAKKIEGMQRRAKELLSAGEKFDPTNQKELEDLGIKFNA